MLCPLFGLASLLFVFSTHGLANPHVRSSIDPLDKFREFDWNFTRAVGSRAKGNVLLSPISLKLVLAMLYEGAGGTTAKELEEVLAIESSTSHSSEFANILRSLQVSNPGYDLDVGMRLYIDHHAQPKQDFERTIREIYNATIEKIDFSNTTSAVKIINDWASSVTKGHVEHLISEADTKASTVMLLLNAVYFKGQWANPFPAMSTYEGEFITDTNTPPIPVKYMVAENTLNYIESIELKSQILRLPYVGNKFSMYIILPESGTSINEVLDKMEPRKIAKLVEDMPLAPVLVTLPRFKFEFASSLAPVLQRLGIKKIFSREADLRNIAEGSKDLVVSNVIQKAIIDVNEQGTTASVVTTVELVNKFGMHTINFNASRPFLFFIEDETTRTVIFVGKVVNPADPGKAKVGLVNRHQNKPFAAFAPTTLPPAPPQTTVPLFTDTVDPISTTPGFGYIQFDLLGRPYFVPVHQ